MAGPEHHRRQRERILLAARNSFAGSSFDDVTVAEIAEAAGVSRATVFNHFGSKAGLVDATVAGVMEFYVTMLDEALADEITTTAGLVVDLFRQMGSGIELDRPYYRGVFHEINRIQFSPDEGDAGYDASLRAKERLVALLQRGIDRGDVHGHRAEILASSFTALSNGLITEWLYSDEESGLTDRLVEAAALLADAMGGPQ